MVNSKRCILQTACLLSLSAPSFSQEYYSLRLSAAATPFLSGDVGNGRSVPEYSDAFDTGFGAGLEFAYRYSELISFAAGLGYESFSGDDYQGISFEDLNVYPVYIGIKYHFRPQISVLDAYIRADAGAARLGSVDVSFEGFDAPYWDESWVTLFDLGFGMEYRFESISLFAEIRARYLDDPDSELEPLSDADESWSLPVSVGVVFKF